MIDKLSHGRGRKFVLPFPKKQKLGRFFFNLKETDGTLFFIFQYKEKKKEH